jgi:hypothetical protein
MVVTMVAVNVMKMTIHQIVYVVAMRDCFVPTARSMDMVCFVTPTTVLRCA